MSDSSKLTLAEFLGLSDTCDVLTEEALTILEGLEALKDSDVRVVAQWDSGSIAKAIAAANPNMKQKSMRIAIALLERLEEAGYTQQVNTPFFMSGKSPSSSGLTLKKWNPQ